MKIDIRAMVAVGLFVAAAADDAGAQLRHESRAATRPARDWTAQNEFGMELYSGVFLDGMVPDNERQMGPLFGVRVTFEPMHRRRFGLDIGYSEVNGVGAVTSGASTFTYGNDWIFTLGGVEFDVVPGNTVGTISLNGGVAWRQNDVERRVIGTDEDPDLGGFTSMTTIAPGIALVQMLSPRAAVRLALQDFIVDVDEDAVHSPAFTLGVVFR